MAFSAQLITTPNLSKKRSKWPLLKIRVNLLKRMIRWRLRWDKAWLTWFHKLKQIQMHVFLERRQNRCWRESKQTANNKMHDRYHEHKQVDKTCPSVPEGTVADWINYEFASNVLSCLASLIQTSIFRFRSRFVQVAVCFLMFLRSPMFSISPIFVLHPNLAD